MYRSMSKLVTTCPSCHSGLKVTQLKCPECSLQIGQDAEIPALFRLEADELDFVVSFVKLSGSLKDMAAKLGLSYPTVRNRLDEIIEKLNENDATLEKQRTFILTSLEKGELTAKQAAKQLKALGL
jgi:hypothetical protein